MPGVTVIRSDEQPMTPGYLAPTVSVEGDAASRWRSPAEFPLWLVAARLSPGATLQWRAGENSDEGAHGDEAVYVLSGELRVGDRVCPTAGALIIEAGVDAQAEVGAESASVLHFGPARPGGPFDGPLGPPAPGARGVHVVGPLGTYAIQTTERDTHYYADSTCPTCRITLLHTGRTVPTNSAAHSHSQDELITLLSGEIIVGNRHLVAGDTIAIGADRRYAFRSGPSGFSFLNYRRDGAYMTTDRADPPRLEGGAANGLVLVNDLR
jgi:uncharacterized cupin superfamily protein